MSQTHLTFTSKQSIPLSDFELSFQQNLPKCRQSVYPPNGLCLNRCHEKSLSKFNFVSNIFHTIKYKAWIFINTFTPEIGWSQEITGSYSMFDFLTFSHKGLNPKEWPFNWTLFRIKESLAKDTLPFIWQWHANLSIKSWCLTQWRLSLGDFLFLMLCKSKMEKCSLICTTNQDTNMTTSAWQLIASIKWKIASEHCKDLEG